MSALRYRGLDILRPMPEAATDPLQSSCFPLMPYCNRLREGRFEWKSRLISLPLNFIPEAHTLHGFGWQVPWNLEQISESQVNLSCGHVGGKNWDWDFLSNQLVTLDETGCSVVLSVTNTSAEPMPLGLGLHPYFRRRPETRVRFTAAAMLENDAETMPTGVALPAHHFGTFGLGDTLPPETIDHCFRDWGSRATIEDRRGTITMTATGTPHLHLYAPADRSALCLEPVSHTPDALNRAPEEMIALPPGETARIAMRIEATLRAS